MIKAVTIDLWNTLLEDKNYYTHRLQATDDVLTDHSISKSPEEIKEAYRSAGRVYRREWEKEHLRMDIDRRVRHMLQGLNVEPEKDLIQDVIDRFEECFVEDPPILKEGVEETLDALSGRYRLGIISDTGVTPGTIIREFLEGRGLLSHFSSTIFSDETGYCKPNPIPFRKALQDIDAEPHEAIHVGDLLRTDIARAKAVGMKTVWVQTEGKTDSEHIGPDYTITRLNQLLAIPELKH